MVFRITIAITRRPKAMNFMNTKPRFALCFLIYTVLISAFVSTAASAQKLPATKPKDVGISSERLQHLDRVFQAYVDDEHMAGSVILATRNGKVFYHKAFGFRDLESQSPMTRDTIFRIASQTKALISVGALILQEQGRLLLSDPVGKYIPEFMHTTVAIPEDDGSYKIEKANRPVTIHDLLTHTSGVGYGNGPGKAHWKNAGIQGWYFADRDEKILATVKRMASLPFESQPGTKWVYGYNTDILGAVLEIASGQALDEFLNKSIILPLGMQDTHFYLPRNKVERLATVYTPLPDSGITRSPSQGTMNAQGAYVDGPRKSFSGGAGLLSTASDYARFLQMIVNGGKLGKIRILSRKSVELMITDHLGDIPFRSGSGFGLGFGIVKEQGQKAELSSVGAFNWGGAYHSTYWGDPKEKLVVVYFTQLRPSTKIDDHRKLRALIYQSIVD